MEESPSTFHEREQVAHAREVDSGSAVVRVFSGEQLARLRRAQACLLHAKRRWRSPGGRVERRQAGASLRAERLIVGGRCWRIVAGGQILRWQQGK